MTSIKIIKKQDGYAYKYDIIDENNRIVYVTKSGFETPEEALEAAKYSYDRRMNPNRPHPAHVEKGKHTKTKEKDKKKEIPFKIKNLEIPDGGAKVLSVAMCGVVLVTAVFGGMKMINEVKGMFDGETPRSLADILPEQQEIIAPTDCDFSNLYIIVRTGAAETVGVGAVTSDMLTRLGVENEIVVKDGDLAAKVSNAISNNPNSNIVVINLEAGLENTSDNGAIIMGDCSNRREYPSDTLAACIRASLKEYNLNPIMRCGEATSGGWRLPSYIEQELTNAALSDSVSQLTIDLPTVVGEDEITRNDAAASVVEGIIRWTSLDVTERYREIYYTAVYGDSLVSVAEERGLTGMFIEENSDINPHRRVTVGDCLTITYLPHVADENVTVYNPYTTTDSNDIAPVTEAYIVQSGDTLTRIANMYGVKIEDIVVPSGNPNNIQVGETLYITTYNLYETHEKNKTEEDENQNQI